MLKYLYLYPTVTEANLESATTDVLLFNQSRLLDFRAKELIGDPNYIFEDELAAILIERGVLTRKPVLNEEGKQKALETVDEAGVAKISKDPKDLIWDLAWGDESFAVLTDKELTSVAFVCAQARVPGFAYVIALGQEKEETSLTEEETEANTDSQDSNESCD